MSALDKPLAPDPNWRRKIRGGELNTPQNPQKNFKPVDAGRRVFPGSRPMPVELNTDFEKIETADEMGKILERLSPLQSFVMRLRYGISSNAHPMSCEDVVGLFKKSAKKEQVRRLAELGMSAVRTNASEAFFDRAVLFVLGKLLDEGSFVCYEDEIANFLDKQYLNIFTVELYAKRKIILERLALSKKLRSI